MNIKLIALDLDGTLLLPDKTLSGENRKVLMRASEENGVHIVLATGRTLSGISGVLEKLPCVRYAVMANGSVVQDIQTGKVITEHLVKTEDALAFYDYAVSRDLMLDFFYQGKRIVPSEWDDRINRMEASEGTKRLLLSDCVRVKDQRGYLSGLPGIEKISIRFPNEAEKNRCYRIIEKTFPQFQICSSLETNIEANCRNVTKAAGIEDLVSYLGIGMESVMAFGDNGNDYEMILSAGIGVAMGNAEESVKKAADRVTGNNTEDGVAQMVREVFGWQQELL
ncbi:MAG: Cof-type HAD-IIB family hydrolase [Lachnospiraceae bacterium]